MGAPPWRRIQAKLPVFCNQLAGLAMRGRRNEDGSSPGSHHPRIDRTREGAALSLVYRYPPLSGRETGTLELIRRRRGITANTGGPDRLPSNICRQSPKTAWHRSITIHKHRRTGIITARIHRTRTWYTATLRFSGAFNIQRSRPHYRFRMIVLQSLILTLHTRIPYDSTSR